MYRIETIYENDKEPLYLKIGTGVTLRAYEDALWVLTSSIDRFNKEFCFFESIENDEVEDYDIPYKKVCVNVDIATLKPYAISAYVFKGKYEDYKNKPYGGDYAKDCEAYENFDYNKNNVEYSEKFLKEFLTEKELKQFYEEFDSYVKRLKYAARLLNTLLNSDK